MGAEEHRSRGGTESFLLCPFAPPLLCWLGGHHKKPLYFTSFASSTGFPPFFTDSYPAMEMARLFTPSG